MSQPAKSLEEEVERLRAFIVGWADNSCTQGTWIERRDEMVLEWGYDPRSTDRLEAAQDTKAWARLSLLEKQQALASERAAHGEQLSVRRTW